MRTSMDIEMETEPAAAPPVDWRRGVDLYLLAGVATYPSFFAECAERLAQFASAEGSPDSRVRILYPYGDHTHRLTGQLRKIGRDMTRRRALGERPAQAASRGGRAPAASCAAAGSAPPDGLHAAADAIRSQSAGRTVIFVGHSGGGVAAYHLMRRLLAEGVVRDCRTAQIGSPKVRIRPELSERVGYFYAAAAGGRRDPVTRLGSWGGMLANGRGLPVWDPLRFAPGVIRELAIVGGHAEYFRGREPYIRDGMSNLERTIHALRAWLNGAPVQ